MKYEAIKEFSSRFPVKKMCKTLELDSSNYYRWINNCKKVEKKLEKEKELLKQIENIFEESGRTYGYRVMKEALKNVGIEISEYKIRKIMKENGLYPETRKKYKPYKNGKKNGRYHKDMIRQNFKTEKVNEVWVGDITYIKTRLGWVYLAAVIDLYNREVIGYAISKKIDTELVKRALGNAIGRRGTKKGMIFHTTYNTIFFKHFYKSFT